MLTSETSKLYWYNLIVSQYIQEKIAFELSGQEKTLWRTFYLSIFGFQTIRKIKYNNSNAKIAFLKGKNKKGCPVFSPKFAQTLVFIRNRISIIISTIN